MTGTGEDTVRGDDTGWLTALELAGAVRRGEVSPVQAVEASLERARTLGPAVGAFVTLTPEIALEAAHAGGRAPDAGGRAAARDAGGRAAARDAGGRASARDGVGRAPAQVAPHRPFLGVPLAVKDLSLVRGVPTRFGSAAFEPLVPEADDGAVTLLREAGCAVVGKTTTPELGLPCYTESDICPPARTPWDLSRSAGGSSGGSAAAVAAGIVPVALGSDGGGSIRIPASACGVVGLKPTRGRISWGPLGVDRSGLASLGVLTRDVRDTAAFLDLLAVPWPGDQFLLPGPRATFLDACDGEPGVLRVGVLTEPVIADAEVHPACLEAVGRVVEVLAGLGHDVGVAVRPFTAERWADFRAVWTVGAAAVPVPTESEPLLTPLTRWLREQGRGISGADYAEAVARVQLTSREVAVAWEAFDVVVCPTLAQPPAPVGSQRDDGDPAADFAAQMAFTPWTSVWNLTGAPAISLPLHWTSPVPGGPELPIGVMVGGRSGEEEILLALSVQLEEALPWRGRRPPVG